MTKSKAKVSYDDQIWIGRTVASVVTWTQIKGLEPVPFPDQIPEKQDATHQQSPGRTRETIPGLLPVVPVSLEKQMWVGDDGDAEVVALHVDHAHQVPRASRDSARGVLLAAGLELRRRGNGGARGGDERGAEVLHGDGSQAFLVAGGVEDQFCLQVGQGEAAPTLEGGVNAL